MKLVSAYRVKIKEYRYIFVDTIRIYRAAVDALIKIALQEWNVLSLLSGQKMQVNAMEHLCVRTKKNPEPRYDFTGQFYKFPSYLRRAAIAEALGKVSSYESNLAEWEETDIRERGRKPGYPRAGYIFPAMYRDNMYVREDDYTASIKVFIRNTWDWLKVQLRKSDVDYILHHCSNRRECVPTLRRKGKEWFLEFVFEEKVTLTKKPVKEQVIASVDMGLINACTISIMNAQGTVLGRKFLSLPREKDSLAHALNRVKKAQQNGAKRMPRLWNRVRGINDDIAVKTAACIMETAGAYHTDVIVFEHLELQGKKRGSKKQQLHMWRARYVQQMVTDKAHRQGMRVSHVNAWGTSKLAYDGSGTVNRGTFFVGETEKTNYSICVFPNGKTYNCDLNASCNIGARYFIREILKSLPEMVRLGIEAKVPRCSRRSTCTLSTLINLCAVMQAETACIG